MTDALVLYDACMTTTRYSVSSMANGTGRFRVWDRQERRPVGISYSSHVKAIRQAEHMNHILESDSDRVFRA